MLGTVLGKLFFFSKEEKKGIGNTTQKSAEALLPLKDPGKHGLNPQLNRGLEKYKALSGARLPPRRHFHFLTLTLFCTILK